MTSAKLEVVYSTEASTGPSSVSHRADHGTVAVTDSKTSDSAMSM